jgi:hypothetical protein
MHTFLRSLSLSLAFTSLAACGKGEAPLDTKAGAPPSASSASAPVAVPAVSPYQLASEPAGAIPVIAAKAKGEARDIVVVGRLKDTVPGLAAFTLTDASIKYCGQDGGEEACETPWDYCCNPPDKIAAATITVAVRAKGEVVAAAIPELRNMDLVVVRGSLTKGDDGTMRLDADGWYRKERPVVPATVVFPK